MRGSWVTGRSSGKLLATAAVVISLSTGCAGDAAEPASFHDGSSAPAASSAPSSTVAASTAAPSTGGSPTVTRSVTTPVRPTATAGRSSAPIGSPVSVRLGDPGPLPTQPFTGIFQEGCGGYPDDVFVSISVADYLNVADAQFDYHVQTPVPFRGTVEGLTIHNRGERWHGTFGPFPADPRNAAGGPITVTARAIYNDGTVRTATATTVLKPCNH